MRTGSQEFVITGQNPQKCMGRNGNDIDNSIENYLLTKQYDEGMPEGNK